MAQEYFILSNFGVRYFLKDYVDADTVPASATADDEITSIISCDIGKFNKNNTKYRTLGGNGWEAVSTLGNSTEDGTFECVREGTGGIYVGTAGTTSYQRIKDWLMKATAGAGVESPKCIVEVLPRGNNTYEGTCYYVVPNNWGPGTKDTETGQEYSFSVTPFGPQIPLIVNYTPASGGTPESWTFSKAANGVTGVSISGNSTVAMGSTLSLTATVSPNTASQDVTWSVTSGTGTATINSSGVLSPVSVGTVTVVATSVADTTKSATKVVTITSE